MPDGGALGLPAHDDREALANFIEGMKVAESAAKQLAFYMDKPEWLTISAALGATRESSIKLAQAQLLRRVVRG